MSAARTVEIRIYQLNAGTGAHFHTLVSNRGIPLHKSAGIDVVAFGHSMHDADSYILVRAFDSLKHLEETLSAFYASDAWTKGPRPEIIACIATSLKSIVRLDADTVESMRNDFLEGTGSVS